MKLKLCKKKKKKSVFIDTQLVVNTLVFQIPVVGCLCTGHSVLNQY